MKQDTGERETLAHSEPSGGCTESNRWRDMKQDTGERETLAHSEPSEGRTRENSRTKERN
jgi:hypothetical protein